MIVVVDGDAWTVRGITRLLRAAGLTVQPFGSAHDVLHANRGDAIACLIVDYHLSDVTGIEVYQQLLVRGVSCPAIFLTPDEDVARRGRLRPPPYSIWLTKPIDETALLDAIRNAVAPWCP